MGLTETWRQAQEATIGSMLLDERCVGPVLQMTGEEHFPDSVFLHLYRAVRALWLERKAVDPVTVLAESGGAYEKAIAETMSRTPTAANAERYVEILRECASLSAYRTAAMDILGCESLPAAEKAWERLGREMMGAKKVRCVSFQEAVGRYLDRMNDDTPPDYLSLGIKQLDKIVRLRRGKFVILAADSSAGKTALGLQFAYHMAECGKKVGFFSLETDNDTLTDRLMAETQTAGIALPRTQEKALSNEDYRRAVDLGMKSARMKLDLLDSCETVDEIRTWTVQKGYDVIFVDYVQLIDGEGEKRCDVVTRVSMDLHRLAQRLGVTVFGLSQVTPPDKNGNRRLTMDDLRESRQLKHDADCIMILERCDEFPEGRTLTVAKNKDGKRNTGMKLRFDPEHMTFSYFRRVEPPATVAGQVDMREMEDGEGGENPFE